MAAAMRHDLEARQPSSSTRSRAARSSASSPTTEAQREIWLADQLGQEASLAYNESVVAAPARRARRRRAAPALDALVERHEALRATICARRHRAADRRAPAPVALAAARPAAPSTSRPERQASAAAGARAAVESRSTLEHGPLFRAALSRLAADQHVLLFTAHHSVCDGWSWGVIADDLGRSTPRTLGAGPTPRCAGAATSTTPPGSSRRGREPGDAGARALLARALLRRHVPVLDLPARPRRARPCAPSARGARTTCSSATLVDALRKLGAQAGRQPVRRRCSRGFAALLHRLTGQDDLVVGIPAAGQSASGMPSAGGPLRQPAAAARRASMPAAAVRGRCVRQSRHHAARRLRAPDATFGTLLQQAAGAARSEPAAAGQRDVQRRPATRRRPGRCSRICDVGARCEPAALRELRAVPQRRAGGRRACGSSASTTPTCSTPRPCGAGSALFECLLRRPRAMRARRSRPLDMLPAAEERRRCARCSRHRRPLRRDAADARGSSGARRPPRPSAWRCATARARCSYAELDAARQPPGARPARARRAAPASAWACALSRGTDMVVACWRAEGRRRLRAARPGVPDRRASTTMPRTRGSSLLVTRASIASAPRAWRSDAAGRLSRSTPTPPGAAIRRRRWRPARWTPDGRRGLRDLHLGLDRQAQGRAACRTARSANFLQSMRSEPGIAGDDRLRAP